MLGRLLMGEKKGLAQAGVKPGLGGTHQVQVLSAANLSSCPRAEDPETPRGNLGL